MKKHITKAAKTFVFFLTGFVILYFVYQRQNKAFQADCALKCIPVEDCSLWAKVATDIGNANYIWVLVPMILFMMTNVIRALRWKMMFSALGYQTRFINLLGTIMINYIANLGIPRSGEIIRAGLISEYENIPIEKSLGTIFTDRIFDVIMLLLVIIFTLMVGGSDLLTYFSVNMDISSKTAFLQSNPLLVAIIVILLLAGVYLLYKKRRALYNTRIGKKLINLVSGFSEGVQSVRNVSSIWLFIFYTVSIWVLYFLMLYLAFRSFGPTEHLGPLAGLIVFMFGSLGILFPSPGGMGSYHFLVGEALAMYSISGSDAFSFANIVFFSIQLFVNIIFGVISLVILPLINKEK
ncbi:MAG: flippase-like domain-containing protein [Saprospiraceae bacterium]|nr:flippase-like domain-containing protein [Saprospiraceae bacterium]